MCLVQCGMKTTDTEHRYFFRSIVDMAYLISMSAQPTSRVLVPSFPRMFSLVSLSDASIFYGNRLISWYTLQLCQVQCCTVYSDLKRPEKLRKVWKIWNAAGKIIEISASFLLRFKNLFPRSEANTDWNMFVFHGWSREQKNEQQNNAPSPKKKCSCRL